MVKRAIYYQCWLIFLEQGHTQLLPMDGILECVLVLALPHLKIHDMIRFQVHSWNM